jgi:hypothetical protein
MLCNTEFGLLRVELRRLFVREQMRIWRGGARQSAPVSAGGYGGGVSTNAGPSLVGEPLEERSFGIAIPDPSRSIRITPQS